MRGPFGSGKSYYIFASSVDSHTDSGTNSTLAGGRHLGAPRQKGGGGAVFPRLHIRPRYCSLSLGFVWLVRGSVCIFYCGVTYVLHSSNYAMLSIDSVAHGLLNGCLRVEECLWSRLST